MRLRLALGTYLTLIGTLAATHLPAQTPMGIGSLGTGGGAPTVGEGGESVFGNPALLGLPGMDEESGTYPSAYLFANGEGLRFGQISGWFSDGGVLSPSEHGPEARAALQILWFASYQQPWGVAVRSYGDLDARMGGPDAPYGAGARRSRLLASEAAMGGASELGVFGPGILVFAGASGRYVRLHEASAAWGMEAGAGEQLGFGDSPLVREIRTTGGNAGAMDVGMTAVIPAGWTVAVSARNLIQETRLSPEGARLNSYLPDGSSRVDPFDPEDFLPGERDEISDALGRMQFPRTVSIGVDGYAWGRLSHASFRFELPGDGTLMRRLEDRWRVGTMDGNQGARRFALGQTLTGDPFVEAEFRGLGCAGTRNLVIGVAHDGLPAIRIGGSYGFGGRLC